MLRSILDAFFPRRSLTGTHGVLVTPEERAALQLSPIVLREDRVRERGALSLATVATAGSYAASPLLRTAIQRYKYGRVRALGREFAMPLVDALTLLLPDEECVLCPVPLHWTRRFARGFNQADDLARHVSALTGLPVRKLLIRWSPTGKQSLRDHDQRKRALVDAFRPAASAMPARVILVDDVATTLSTLDACARCLREAGVQRVDGLAVALG